MELTAAYDDVNKKLAGSLQQYDITFKQLRQIEAEFKGLSTSNAQSVKVSFVRLFSHTALIFSHKLYKIPTFPKHTDKMIIEYMPMVRRIFIKKLKRAEKISFSQKTFLKDF